MISSMYASTPMAKHPDSDGMTLPKGKRCTNEESFCGSPDPHDKFCRTCGKELEEFVEDLYITISTQYPQTPVPSGFLYMDNANKPEPDPDAPVVDSSPYERTITLKNLVRLIRECEKEMFIEEI